MRRICSCNTATCHCEVAARRSEDTDVEWGLHWHGVAVRLLADIDAIRRTIEQIEAGLPRVKAHQTTVTADDLHFLGSCRVLCEIALEDHADQQIPHVELRPPKHDASPEALA